MVDLLVDLVCSYNKACFANSSLLLLLRYFIYFMFLSITFVWSENLPTSACTNMFVVDRFKPRIRVMYWIWTFSISLDSHLMLSWLRYGSQISLPQSSLCKITSSKMFRATFTGNWVNLIFELRANTAFKPFLYYVLLVLLLYFYMFMKGRNLNVFIT